MQLGISHHWCWFWNTPSVPKLGRMVMLMVLVLMMWHCIGLSRSASLQTTMMMLMMMVIMVLMMMMMMMILMQIRWSVFRNYEIACLRFRVFLKNDFQSRLLQSRFLQKKYKNDFVGQEGRTRFLWCLFIFLGKRLWRGRLWKSFLKESEIANTLIKNNSIKILEVF